MNGRACVRSCLAVPSGRRFLAKSGGAHLRCQRSSPREHRRASGTGTASPPLCPTRTTSEGRAPLHRRCSAFRRTLNGSVSSSIRALAPRLHQLSEAAVAGLLLAPSKTRTFRPFVPTRRVGDLARRGFVRFDAGRRLRLAIPPTFLGGERSQGGASCGAASTRSCA
jgi:hypothetical protein